MEMITSTRGIPDKAFEPSLSSKYIEKISQIDSSNMVPYSHWSSPCTENIKLIEATIWAWKTDSSIQRYTVVRKAAFDVNTVFEFPAKEVKDVSIRVRKMGQGKIEAAFDIEDFELIEQI